MLAALQCSNVEIAAFFGCDEGTIRKRFSEELTKGRQNGKISLRRKQWEAAKNGNVTMLIWLGKQWLGQSDKQDIAGETESETALVKTADAGASGMLATTVVSRREHGTCFHFWTNR
ncbi:MAG: hypothetical protein C4521_01015 [Actinobacteria bacterium]|nr:MAG: hypothetical protein C4521_01015 [Actinomycetota bacterium]